MDITAVEVIGNHRLTFEDETVGDVDFSEREWRGVVEPLRDPACFACAEVDPEAGTIAWSNGVDMDPEPLYAEVRANSPTRRPRADPRRAQGDHASVNGAVPGAVLGARRIPALQAGSIPAGRMKRRRAVGRRAGEAGRGTKWNRRPFPLVSR